MNGKYNVMNVKEMEENGTIDYYLELKKYISQFINKNYPLSQEDLRTIINDNPSDNVKKRNQVAAILNDSMEECLNKLAQRNAQMLDNANRGKITPFSVQNFEQEIFGIKQERMQKLWKAEHPKDTETEKTDELER